MPPSSQPEGAGSPRSERRRGPNREKYLALRFYAKMLTFLGFFSVAVGVVFGVLVVLYAEVDDKLRYSRALLSVLLGGIGYVILRATAQAIYLLFDVARNTQAARETLEKRDREESEPPRKIQAGD